MSSERKKLYRSTTDRRFAGVCGGLAEFFDIDPHRMRIATILLFVFTGGSALFAYLIAMFFIPEEDTQA